MEKERGEERRNSLCVRDAELNIEGGKSRHVRETKRGQQRGVGVGRGTRRKEN